MPSINAKLAMRILVAAGICVLLYSILFSSSAGRGENVPEYSILTLDGEKVSSTDFSNRPYLLHFWAHWCDKCVFELESFSKLQDIFKGALLIVNVHIGKSRKDQKLAAKIHKDRGLNYTEYFDDGRLADIFGVETVPAAFFIDRHGVIVEKISGPVIWTSPERIESIKQFIKRPY